MNKEIYNSYKEMPKIKKEDIEKATLEIWKSPLFTPRLKMKFFDDLLWGISELNGKYSTNFISKGALDEVGWSTPLSKEKKGKICHEHFISRGKLRLQMVNAKSRKELLELLNMSIGITILRTEHLVIGHKIEGFSKYQAKGIKIFDRHTKKEVQSIT